MSPFTYIPDEYIDFGDLGEHEVTFIAMINEQDGAMIMNATARIVLGKTGNQSIQELDVTKALQGNEYWKSEIFKKWKAGFEKEWETAI